MNDERVSRTYRSVATERTPGHLDEAVLAEAARAAEPRYSRLTRWTRPLAWAATIMLSVAVVLELTRAPVPEAAMPVSEPDRVEAQQSPDADVMEPAPAETKAEPEVAVDRVERFMDAPPREDPAAPATAGERRERVFEADAFDVSDAELRQQAEEFERLQEGTVSRTTAPGRSAAALESAAPGCSDTVTADPETWLRCIEDLEAAGFTEIAARERELLADNFPDFDTD